MRYLLATVGFIAGCTSSPPLGVFDVKSSADEQVIGHCVDSATSVEAMAYTARAKELAGATVKASPVPGFRSITVREPDYRYVLYVPVPPQKIQYHVVCPWDGARDSCTIAGRFPSGIFEAYASLRTVEQVEAAANAAFSACAGHDG
jgi:hypothetical protein